MRILHISDTHGMLPEPPDPATYDVVVHSGDMMPNRSFGIREIENVFQRYWIEENAPKFHLDYWAKPFLYVPGNHDYVDPTPAMRLAGIDAKLLCNDVREVKGVRFYGSPWTPEFCGWNWMCGPTAMAEHLAPAKALMDKGLVDVLVTHGPMFGVLDRNREGDRCGCKVLREIVQGASAPPKLLLHGHIHEAAGYIGWTGELRISNAALTQRIVTL